MDKLIELLETFEKEKVEKLKSDVWKNDTISPRIWSKSDVTIYNKLQVISKEYGFIKRLVENNRIDTQNLITYMNGTSLTFNKVPSTDCAGIEKTWNKFYTECLLMLLSIQDNPIEFLVVILK